MSLLAQIFTWWNGQTVGTRLSTWRSGEKVGTDDQGNTFYQSGGGKRRWVIYNGPVEASRISPDWHGWLHFTYDEAPTEAPLKHRAWEKPHLPNLTGTDAAYHPPGSILTPSPARRPEYEAWAPEG
ncbi:NADH:ubiquinone oxidoreductase subunit NDUFA12 [Oceanicella sp. SM1341]|uniref:NADH:ubiquinone oxidoreductase subunit NDUFA12 n=1 Tax=Oceanicella sp. SM1341 TaxID=1548889 RepID=UPI000E5325E8|nr:NADH:ubiquinone oxidoreductase subunit NDUFA12 [Oceanicella sp. SM1341]